MARARSRIERLKIPFVVTAVSVGCGGSVDDESPEHTMNPPPPECPAEAPEPGAPCDRGPGPPCQYGDCYGTPTLSAGCLNGTWTVTESSCNPPPPVEYDCPDLAPAAGSYCNYEGPSCQYGYCPMETAECHDHVWTVTTATCHPPAIETSCPESAPEDGSYCNYEGPGCEYEFYCNGSPTEFAQCEDNTWLISISSCNPPPPAEADGGAG